MDAVFVTRLSALADVFADVFSDDEEEELDDDDDDDEDDELVGGVFISK